MKRSVFVLLFIVVSFLLLSKYFNSNDYNHYVIYDIMKNEEKVTVSEKYINDDEKYYFLNVNYKDIDYVFDKEDIFSKEKKIVSDIKIYEDSSVSCITLIYKNDDRSIPLCNKEGMYYSPLYFISDDNLKDYFIEVGYKYDYDYSYDKIYEDLSINTKKIKENILVYNYKNIINIDNDNISNFSFSSFDNYKNNMGIIVDNYYVVPRIIDNLEYKSFIIYDILKDKYDEVDVKLSKNTYILGVYEHSLYLFDKSNLKEYVLDVKEREINLIGDTESSGYVFRNGIKETVSVYDLSKENISFSLNLSLYDKIDYDSIYPEKRYAIFVNNGEFYKVYNDSLDKVIYLFENHDAKEIKVVNGDIYYIEKDKLYRYSEYELVSLVSRNEFLYNHENIYDVYVR